MLAAAAGLRLGKALILFPEGERTIDGTIKPFRKGAAILASHLDVPIVPAALDGLFPIWPRGRTIQWRALAGVRRRGSRLTFGTPLRLTSVDPAVGTAALQNAVATLNGHDANAQAAPRVLER
jgi:1-acyl-sn-glycerol-3-phosphate acyltransferase